MTTTPTVGRVTSGFGPRTPPRLPDGTYGSAYHNGTDISAPTGRVVVAPQPGTVITSTYNSIRGNYVVIQHTARWRTLHQHLNSQSVGVGATVSEGQQVGTVGNTGASQAAHLHTEVHDNGVPIDPTPWYNSRGVILGVASKVLSGSTDGDDMYNDNDRYGAGLVLGAVGRIEQRTATIVAAIPNLLAAINAVSAGEPFDEEKLLAGVNNAAEAGTRAAVAGALADIDDVIRTALTDVSGADADAIVDKIAERLRRTV